MDGHHDFFHETPGLGQCSGRQRLTSRTAVEVGKCHLLAGVLTASQFRLCPQGEGLGLGDGRTRLVES